jgi:hypothetical protein
VARDALTMAQIPHRIELYQIDWTLVGLWTAEKSGSRRLTEVDLGVPFSCSLVALAGAPIDGDRVRGTYSRLG